MQNKTLTKAHGADIIEFKKASREHIDEITEAVSRYTGRMCDVSAGNLIFWNDYYQTYFYNGPHGFIIKFLTMDNRACHVLPFGAKDKELITLLAKQAGGEICLSCLSVEEADFIAKNFKLGGTLYSRDWDDYIYRAEDLITFSGKRLGGQRNHTNKFKKLYPDYVYEKITNKNAPEIQAFIKDFYEKRPPETQMTVFEAQRLYEMFEDYESYGQVGGVLKVGADIVGFSFGEVIGDTLIVHGEKANTSYAGAYPMLVQHFSAEFGKDCEFINREEDCGEEGLRISKLSYHPVELIQKHAARVIVESD